MLYSMSYEDHREMIEVLEFESPNDASAAKLARHHLSVIKAIFRRDHPYVRLRPDWFVLWIVINVETGKTVYKRPRA